MSKRFTVWDGISLVYTPSGAVFTPEQWLNKYPAYSVNPNMVMVLGPNPVNGSFIGELSQMLQSTDVEGVIDPTGMTNQEVLDAIEQLQDEQNAKLAEEAAAKEEEEAAAAAEALATQQSIAASLEFQNMMNY